ncbi:MAG: RNA polymerase Rpb4 family protein [Pyrobaculum sp.]
MGVKKIRRSEEVTNARSLEILRALATTYTLSDEQKKTLDYLEKTVKRTSSESEQLVKRLMEKFGFTKITAIQLVNLSIESIEELKFLLTHLERREYSETELKELYKVLTER